MTAYNLGRKRADRPKAGQVDRGEGRDDFGAADDFND